MKSEGSSLPYIGETKSPSEAFFVLPGHLLLVIVLISANSADEFDFKVLSISALAAVAAIM